MKVRPHSKHVRQGFVKLGNSILSRQILLHAFSFAVGKPLSHRNRESYIDFSFSVDGSSFKYVLYLVLESEFLHSLTLKIFSRSIMARMNLYLAEVSIIENIIPL